MEPISSSQLMPHEIWLQVADFLAWTGAPGNLKRVDRMLFLCPRPRGVAAVISGSARTRAFETFQAQIPQLRRIRLSWTCPLRNLKLTDNLFALQLTVDASAILTAINAILNCRTLRDV